MRHGHGPRRGEWRIAWYVRARLQRRLFFGFGAAIVLTGLAVLGTTALFGSGRTYAEDVEGVRALIGERFAATWSDAAAREELGRSIAEHLRVGLTLRDEGGAALATFGGACIEDAHVAPVVRGGVPLGRVEVCLDGRRPRGNAGIAAVFVALVVLWALSGLLARKLSRPMVELARVAEAIGSGKLDTRMPIHRGPTEVSIVGQAINEMAARIERQLADQRELLATVSHELRTPLSRIRLLVELAREGVEAPKKLDEIDGEVVAIDELVGELLASSRIDFSALTTTSLSAREMAERALTRANKPVSLLVDRAEGARFRGDATLVARALANLLANAERHGGGATALSVELREGKVAFVVEDGGAGIPAGDEERVFEPFYRRHTGGDQGSLGLGLALVRRIARAHGGDAKVEKKADPGARIALVLGEASAAEAVAS